MARAQAETEARLEQQLASVIGEAEQVRHAHRQATFDADQIRTEAAQAARAAAEAALAAETERIRSEANQRLEAEIARLRTEAARTEAQRIESARVAERPGDLERRPSSPPRLVFRCTWFAGTSSQLLQSSSSS